MTVKDAATVAKIAMTVIGLFSLSNAQEREINLYVKDNMYKWAEQRKEDSEIEAMVRSEINRIGGK